jgi:AbrB family looped-hinge helix DNA binding protein
VETVKVSSKGQIVIPKALRESRHITTGTELAISIVGDELRLAPVPPFRKTSAKSVAGMLHRPARKRLSDAESRRAIGRMIETRNKASRNR